MNRVIFSLYIDIQKPVSHFDNKDKFNQNYSWLLERQQEYAELCGADTSTLHMMMTLLSTVKTLDRKYLSIILSISIKCSYCINKNTMKYFTWIWMLYL